jgi:sporulation protein YlmC with PRC-barrel domain
MNAEPAQRMDLVYRLLDDQLLDVDGRRCGRVDDLEFEGGIGEPPRLHAILSGSGTWHRRLPRPLRRLSERIFGRGTLGRDVIRVPWSEVETIGTAVKLRGKARDLGLGQGDRRLAGVLGKLPDA